MPIWHLRSLLPAFALHLVILFLTKPCPNMSFHATEQLAVASHCRQPDAQRYLQPGYFPSHPLGFFYPQIPSQAGYKLVHL